VALADELKIVVDGSVLILGIVGFLVGLSQYQNAQTWKRSEWAAEQLRRLDTDPELALCRLFLDWSTRDVAVLEKYRPYIESLHFEHTWEKLIPAMDDKDVRDRPGKKPYSWEQMAYRDAFDHFFEYLQDIDHYINRRLLTIEDVAPLRYWLEQLSRSRFISEASPEAKNPFVPFLVKYHYPGVISLTDKFGVPMPISDDQRIKLGLVKP
jgi:hypothetical protein